MTADDVGPHVAELPGSFGAVRAGIGLLPTVYHVVVSEMTFLLELFGADGAAELHLGQVRRGVNELIERRAVRKLRVAVGEVSGYHEGGE